jgi:hypothetical protein
LKSPATIEVIFGLTRTASNGAWIRRSMTWCIWSLIFEIGKILLRPSKYCHI